MTNVTPQAKRARPNLMTMTDHELSEYVEQVIARQLLHDGRLQPYYIAKLTLTLILGRRPLKRSPLLRNVFLRHLQQIARTLLATKFYDVIHTDTDELYEFRRRQAMAVSVWTAPSALTQAKALATIPSTVSVPPTSTPSITPQPATVVRQQPADMAEQPAA
jgi:hypothetical protein